VEGVVDKRRTPWLPESAKKRVEGTQPRKLAMIDRRNGQKIRMDSTPTASDATKNYAASRLH
jgi:hypothetical protein